MFGRRRANNVVGGMADADGATDPTSAAYSPAIRNQSWNVERRDVQGTPPGYDPADPVNARAEYRVGPANYIDQTVGGQAGSRAVLGYSTGLQPRKTRRPPLTGRVLIVPNMGVHPVLGEVGRSNRANKLWAGVRDQSTNFLPDNTEIAQQFVGRARFQLASDTEDE